MYQVVTGKTSLAMKYVLYVQCTFVCRTRKILKRRSGDTKFEFPAVTPSGIGKIEGLKTCLFVTDK